MNRVILYFLILIIIILNITILLKQDNYTNLKMEFENTYTVGEIDPKELSISQYFEDVRLDVQNIQQLPELPSGCEITSATIVLNYYKYNVNKMEMLKYLPIDRLDDNVAVSPYEAFIGHPTEDGYGCYAPVIEKAINSYFDEINETSNIAKDISGSSPKELYKYVSKGIPVIVWVTINMKSHS